jgi:hypothetical protein
MRSCDVAMKWMPDCLTEDGGTDDGEQQGGKKKIDDLSIRLNFWLLQPRSLVYLFSLVPVQYIWTHLASVYSGVNASDNTAATSRGKVLMGVRASNRTMNLSFACSQRQTASSHILHAALNHTRQACISCKDILSDAVGEDSLHYAIEQELSLGFLTYCIMTQ